jgi:hypothetical protein
MEEVLHLLEAELYRLQGQEGPALLTRGADIDEENKK